MRKKKMVSIIVPVYNNEKYLEKCLDSILKQSYSNLEVLLLDDASSDNSYKIMKSYKKQFPEIIKIFKNKYNMGVSKTRNKALKLISGDYVVFIDSDDYVDNDYIEKLVSGIGNNDIIISGYRRISNSGKVLYKKIPKCLEWDKYKYVFVAGKMYKSKFLKKNGREFNDLRIAEDVIFYMQSYSLTEKISIINYAGYNYVTSDSSVMLNSNKKDNIVVNIVKPINQFIVDSSVTKFKKDNNEMRMLMFFYLKTVIYFLLDKRKDMIVDDIYLESIVTMKWIEEVYAYNKCDLKFYFQKGEDFSVNLVVNIFLLMYKVKLLKVFFKILMIV